MSGRVAVSDGIGAGFAPEGLPPLQFDREVRLMAGVRFHGCRDCDLIWSRAVEGHLERVLGAHR